MFPEPKRVHYKGLVFEENQDGFRLVGAGDHAYTLDEIVDRFEKLKAGLSSGDLAGAQAAAAKAFASGIEMEGAQEALDRMRANNRL